jgi:hypothetical protein
MTPRQQRVAPCRDRKKEKGSRCLGRGLISHQRFLLLLLLLPYCIPLSFCSYLFSFSFSNFPHFITHLVYFGFRFRVSCVGLFVGCEVRERCSRASQVKGNPRLRRRLCRVCPPTARLPTTATTAILPLRGGGRVSCRGRGRVHIVHPGGTDGGT